MLAAGTVTASDEETGHRLPEAVGSSPAAVCGPGALRARGFGTEFPGGHPVLRLCAQQPLALPALWLDWTGKGASYVLRCFV